MEGKVRGYGSESKVFILPRVFDEQRRWISFCEMRQEIVFHRTYNDHDLSAHAQRKYSVRQLDIRAEAAEQA
jgi:hypothetical protein